GGFLGLDNISVLDRSVRLPGGGRLEQCDGTGWMAMFCLNLMRIALELAKDDPVYETLATKFFQHYVYVAAAMRRMGGGAGHPLWDAVDGFFHDVIRYPDGSYKRVQVRSLVGLVPLFAAERLCESELRQLPCFHRDFKWFLENRPELVAACVRKNVSADAYLLTAVDDHQMHALLQRVWDPREFLSDFGLRSLSRYHLEHPFVLDGDQVSYEPGDSHCCLKGGNSNWRGPVWFPTTFMMIESLRKLGKAYGPLMEINNPVAEEPPITFDKMAQGFADRLISIFTRAADGRRAVYGENEKFQNDPYWRDLILFYEYFHGDTGSGLGASHQTGWTGLVASLIDEWRK
nr:glucosidase [Blastocatellia bacterium]